MSKTRAYSDETKDIMRRYFEAVDKAVELKRIKLIRSFCVNNGIVPEAIYRQRMNQACGFFEVASLVPLVRDSNVSSSWLLTGVGSMFNC